MNPILLVRTSLGICSSVAATTVTGNILRAFTPRNPNTFLKVIYAIGHFAITCTAGLLVQKAVEKAVDETVDQITAQ